MRLQGVIGMLILGKSVVTATKTSKVLISHCPLPPQAFHGMVTQGVTNYCVVYYESASVLVCDF